MANFTRMRFIYYRTFFLIIFSILISSCSTAPIDNSNFIPNAKVEKKPPSRKDIIYIAPEWFSSKQSNSVNILYGFGSGESLDYATKNALSDMVQRLQVTVSATTSFENISNNDKISQKLVQQITTQTTDINIPNYTVINQQKSGDIYYVELQINKNQTVYDLKNLIDSNINQAQQLLISTENKSSLYRFNISQQVSNNLRIIKSSLKTLVILSPEANIEQWMEDLNTIDNKLLNLKRSLQIYIDKQDSGFFYDSLKKYLNVGNYNLITQKDYANIYITLKLKDYDNSNINNEYCLNSLIELQVRDNISGDLSPKQYIIKACSQKGRLSAIDKAVEIFYSQLNNAESIYL